MGFLRFSFLLLFSVPSFADSTQVSPLQCPTTMEQTSTVDYQHGIWLACQVNLATVCTNIDLTNDVTSGLCSIPYDTATCFESSGKIHVPACPVGYAVVRIKEEDTLAFWGVPGYPNGGCLPRICHSGDFDSGISCYCAGQTNAGVQTNCCDYSSALCPSCHDCNNTCQTVIPPAKWTWINTLPYQSGSTDLPPVVSDVLCAPIITTWKQGPVPAGCPSS